MRVALISLLALPLIAQTQTPAPSCSTATMSGTYYLTLTGRNLNSSMALSASYQAVGTASFDGMGNVSFALTSSTNVLQGVTQALSGTYTLPSNCAGTVTIATGDSATYTLIAWNQGKNFTITGYDATYALSGTGGLQPPVCATSLLSGTYVFSGNGYTVSPGSGMGSAIASVFSISGLLTFDGRGSITGNWTTNTNGSSTPDSISGTYSLNSSCAGTATVADSSSTSWTLTFTMTATDGANFTVDGANQLMQFSAAGHSTFTNPGLAVVSSASGANGATPAGSLFSIYGNDLAPSNASAPKVPLPDILATTSVTVNNEQAPLFFVSDQQINAQMPWDIQPGLANVVVTNVGGMTNTVGVTVPATGTPGVFTQLPTIQAILANKDNSLNTPSNPAHVGDIVVAYFTGGGPVNPAGPLVTGDYSPLGISRITAATSSVTVAGVQAQVNYIGLTGMLVGVYQANFVIPKVSAGNRNLVDTIDGKASTVTTISVEN